MGDEDKPVDPNSATAEIREKQAYAEGVRAARRKRMVVSFGDGPTPDVKPQTLEELVKRGDRPYKEPTSGRLVALSDLEKGLQTALVKREGGVSRLGFTADPDRAGYDVIYQTKPRGIPDWMLKRVARTSDIVGAIVRTRANQMKAFGVPRPDRHSTGFVIEPKEGVTDDYDDARLAAFDKRIERARDLLLTCGSEEGYEVSEQMTLVDFFDVITQSAMINGRVGVEKINDSDERPHSFRPLDGGAMFPATPQQSSGASIRKRAAQLLARLQNKKLVELEAQIDIKDWVNDKYSWVLVTESTPRQVFTDKQVTVKNFYPVPDYEMGGFPWTPLDSVSAAVETQINITTYSKVYFQSGRAAKGALIFQSEELDQEALKDLQQHMQANINSANKAWRLPVIGVGKDDVVTWQPIDQQGGRDMEFQYLADSVARAIMSAFQISPDEMTGWAYLSKGTAAQTLSEGSNEYRLESHRDLGIRPLIRQIEELVNTELLPIVDPGLNELCRFRMYGLDAEGPDKELEHVAEAAPLHMTYNQILEKFEKEPLPPHLGGDVPLNPQFHGLVLDKFVTVGWVREYLLGIKDASKDPRFDYVSSPMYFQQQQLIQQAQMAAQQAQAAQQQAAQQQAQAPNTGAEAQPGAERAAPAGTNDPARRTDDLQRSLDEAARSLGKNEDGTIDLAKAERQLTPAMRRVLRQHRELVQHAMRGFKADSVKAKEEILASVEQLLREGE